MRSASCKFPTEVYQPLLNLGEGGLGCPGQAMKNNNLTFRGKVTIGQRYMCQDAISSLANLLLSEGLESR